MQEIADAVGLTDEAVRKETTQFFTGLEKVGKINANFQDSEPIKNPAVNRASLLILRRVPS